MTRRECVKKELTEIEEEVQKWKNARDEAEDTVDENDAEKYENVRYSKYGLGTVRTLDQAIEFSGFSPTERKMIGRNRCGNVKWVPYEYDKSLTTKNCSNKQRRRPSH